MADGLNARDLRTAIELRREVRGTPGEWGQPMVTTELVAKLWADVRYLRGLESIKADAATATRRASVRIRWREGITPDMQCWIGDVAHNILQVLPDQRRRYIDMVAEATT